MIFKDIAIYDKPLDITTASDLAASDGAGALNIFAGYIRNKTKSKDVVRLDYEAYEPMALKVMTKIAEEASQKWPIDKVVIHHRVGTLHVGEIAVIIAVSTPHRQESFAACQYIIDTLKLKVPIWKKEIFTDGEEWVSDHP